MLKLIMFSLLILMLSCSTTKTEKKDTKKTTVVGNEQLTHDSMKVYELEGKVTTLDEMKKESEEYFKKYQNELLKIKSAFLKEEVDSYLKKNKIEDALVTIPEETFKIDIENSAVHGKFSAKHTFVVFSDFECPYCSKSAFEFEKEIMKLEDIKVVFKHFPLSFHKHARVAAIAAECARKQNKFWEYHDLLFQNQESLSGENFVKWAEELKLNIDDFKKCIDDPLSLVAVLKDQNDGIKAGVNGTPSYYLNNKKYNGERSLEAFKQNYKKYLVDVPALEKIEVMDTVILKTSDKTFTIEQFYKEIPKDKLDSFKSDLKLYEYKFLKQLAESLITNSLFEKEAKLNNLNIKEFLEKLSKDVRVPTEEEIKAVYERYKNSLNGKTYDESKNDIKKYMYTQNQKQFFAKKRDELFKKYKAKILLVAPKVNIDISNSPFKGDKDAKNTIIVFSDFQCPFCAKAKVIEDKISKLKNVKLVFKHFPLSFHPKALPAATASYCAFKQNKFWEYHDMIFENQDKLSLTNLLVWAENLKLDMDKFNKCFENKVSQNMIKKDIQDGIKAKVEGTPTIYINGMKYEDSFDVESIKKVLK